MKMEPGNSTLLGITELIDLALGSPEIGVVNFNILHALLHVMAKEIFDIEKSRVELIQSIDGKFDTVLHKSVLEDTINATVVRKSPTDNNEMVSASLEMFRRKAGMDPREPPYELGGGEIKSSTSGEEIDQNLTLHTKLAKKKYIESKAKTDEENFLEVLKPIDLLESDEECNDSEMHQTGIFDLNLPIENKKIKKPTTHKKGRTLSSKLSKTKKSSGLYLTIDKPNLLIPSLPSEIDKHSSLLEKEKNQRNLQIVPSSEEIMLRTGNENFVTDGEQPTSSILVDESRVDDKDEFQLSILNFTDQQKILNLVKMKSDEEGTDDQERLRGGEDDRLRAEINKLKNIIKEMNVDLITKINDISTGAFKKAIDERFRAIELHQKASSFSTEVKNEDLKALITEINEMQNESRQLKVDIRDIIDKIHTTAKVHEDIEEKMNFPLPTSKTQFDYFKQRFEKIDSNVRDLRHNYIDLQKELCTVSARVGEQSEKRNGSKSSAMNLIDLHEELQLIKKYIENVMTQIKDVANENEISKNLMEHLKLTLNILATKKLDKEEIDELLSEKADYRMLQRKVSIESFDSNRRKLEKSLNEILQRIADQEQLLQGKYQILNEIINKKLDEDALKPLQQFLENKLQSLTEKLLSMQTTNKEPEGIATRSTVLRNVNCIACDHHVLMRTEAAGILPKPDTAHATPSIRPGLLYDLDKLKGDMKKMSQSRNMKHFEIINTFGDKLTKDIQICNRYCGGSHTRITNQIRNDVGIGHTTNAANRPKKTNVTCVCRKQ